MAIILEPFNGRAFARYATESGGLHCIEFIGGAVTRDEVCEGSDIDVPFAVGADLDHEVHALVPTVQAEVGSPLMSRFVIRKNADKGGSDLTVEFFRVDPMRTETELDSSGNECNFLAPQKVIMIIDGKVIENSKAYSVSYSLPADGNCDYAARLLQE